MVDAPRTAEGWYMLHDFRTVDWDAWRDAPEREREGTLDEAIDHLGAHEAVEDAPEGDSAIFAILGHKADLLIVHLRSTLEAVERAERSFETTAFAGYTERAHSYVSVTEVSGYVSSEYFEDEGAVDEGLRRYIEGKLEPELPEDGYVSFYPMSKRRGETHNWYDLPFEERAELMADHGDVARKFAGRIRQIIASSVGLDDWEWGVTLFGDDPTDIKDVVYELRFDEASSKYGEFGQFYVGRRFRPADLPAYMAGEPVPAGADADGRADDPAGRAGERAGGRAGRGADGRADRPSSGREGATPEGDDARADDPEAIREELADLDIYAGRPHGEDVYAMVLYSEADVEELIEAVEGLRGNFEHYDTHVKTAVYEATGGDRTAVASIWETASAAETAGGFLADLPDVVDRADGNGADDGFATMGMFYTVKPDERDAFVGKFETVDDLLAGMDGHRGTELLANREDGNDMFIASRWDSRADAMEFFRSEAFRDTVSWGRDVLADRPRHVFLA